MKNNLPLLGMFALFMFVVGFATHVVADEPGKTAEEPDKTVEESGTTLDESVKAAEEPGKPATKPAKPFKKKSQRTDITSSRMEYDYAESTIIFEENVKVVDEEYTLTSDRLIVFLEGTNEVRQIRAIGHVYLVSGDRTGRSPEAVYTKKTGEIVMTGPNDTAVQLTSKDDKIWGRKITIWLDDQRMVCVPARLTLIDSNPAKTMGTDKNGEEKRVLP